MKKIIATWMYCHSNGDNPGYLQIDGGVDELRIQSVYWKCVFSFFASSHRLNKNKIHLLFANQLPPSSLDGKDTEKLMIDYAVRVMNFHEITRPPKEYYLSWNSQFILLDIIDVLKTMIEKGEITPDDVCMVLDSDCIFNRSLGEEFESDVRRYGALLYTIDYTSDDLINGLSLRELEQLTSEYGGIKVNPFKYCGGEFFCALASEIPVISRESREAYAISIDRYNRGENKFNEEAHLLSYVYHKLGYQSHTANSYVKRIWTNSRYFRNVSTADADLAIWHLPDQKMSGVPEYFNSISSGETIERDHLANMFRIKQSWLKTYSGNIIRWLHTISNWVRGSAR